MYEGPGLVIEGLAVVDVELALGFSAGVERDEEGVRIPAHEATAFPGAIFARDDMACVHQHRDFFQGRGDGDRAACAGVGSVGEIVVVGFSSREVDIDTFCAFSDDWFYEQTGGANVELIFEGEAGFVIGMDVVVRLEDWCTRDRGGVECCVPSWE